MGILEGYLESGVIVIGFINCFWLERDKYIEIFKINLSFWNNLVFLFIFKMYLKIGNYVF